jgi:hypothetical protein
MLVEPSPTPTVGLACPAAGGLAAQRFPTDRAKPSGTYALAEQLGNVNAAAKKLEDHLAIAAQGLHPPPPRHASAQPAPERCDMGGCWR